MNTPPSHRSNSTAGRLPDHAGSGIYLLAGRIQSGKTIFVARLADLLEKRSVKVHGFLCPGWFREGRRDGFHLMNIDSGEKLLLATTVAHPGWHSFRRFWFNPDAFRAGESWVRAAIARKPGLLVVDEIGPMEAEGEGWRRLLEWLAKEPDILQLWVTRLSMVDALAEEWKIPGNRIYWMDDLTPESAAERIVARINKHHGS